MKILREVDGKWYEFELTSDEMYNAYCEKEYQFDRQDIEDVFDGMDEEDVVLSYGLGKAVIESLYEDMAEAKRQNMDKYDVDWVAARDCAIDDTIREYKSKHA